ncbi:MAG: hypothetical protein RLZZ361_1414 [Cyanobacteriota bacterium]|jgi:chorismate dehydratase
MLINKPLIKLGQINFINCLPVNLPLAIYRKESFQEFELSVIEGVPSALNKALRTNEIDIAPISSYEFLCNKNLYEIIPDLSISSFRQADSVNLFLKKNLQINEIQEIFLTNKSASSVNLLKILLKDFWGLNLETIKFRFFDQDPSDCVAKLLIGDEALKQKTSNLDFVAIDLGTAWYEYSGLPMVFGLWTFNVNSACFSDLKTKEALIKLLNSSRDKGLDLYLPNIIVEAYRITGIPKKILADYFKNLNYQFNAAHQAGLALYETKLREFNLIKDLSCK